MAAKSGKQRALSPNHERQVRLLLRILESPRPLTAREIYSSVDEYRERFQLEGDNSSLEKLFERDRAALARTGIEIGTVAEPTAPGDRAQWRYQVVKDAAGGASFELTAEELLLVNEATEAWLDPEIESDARRTFVKLLGQAEAGGVAPTSTIRTVVSTHPLFGDLRDAVARKQRICFNYAKLGSSEPELRDVDALALFSHRGRWLLHGYDHLRDAPRNFLLTRILSGVNEVAEHDRLPAHVSALIARLDEIAQAQPVTVLVKSQSEAEVSLRSRTQGGPTSLPATEVDAESSGWSTLEIHDWDLGLLADELAGYGAAVRVLEPAEFAEQVRDRLRAVISAHRDGDTAASGVGE